MEREVGLGGLAEDMLCGVWTKVMIGGGGDVSAFVIVGQAGSIGELGVRTQAVVEDSGERDVGALSLHSQVTGKQGISPIQHQTTSARSTRPMSFPPCDRLLSI